MKQHLGARDDEIRIILASTEWRELLVPFSRFVADTNLAVVGLQLRVEEASKVVTASRVSLLPMTQGRFIAPWHEVSWYLNQNSLDKGIASIETCCRAKWIDDYVIVLLQCPQPVHSEHQAAMWGVLRQMVESNGASKTITAPELPTYEFIAYFAMQALSAEQCLKVLERDPDQLGEAKDTTEGMDENDTLRYLHESVLSFDPCPEQDHLEIGYPAKFAKFLDQYGYRVKSVLRFGMFARNELLDDDSILSELRGEDGSTRQRFRRSLSIANRAHIAAAKSDISACLEQNPVWRAHILRELEEIQNDFPEAEVDISIFNPQTGVLTLYLTTTREDGLLYVPTYSLIVRDPEPVRMYYGCLQADGVALTFRQLLNKYYEGDVWGLLFTMTWGGYESRDSDIVEDIGCAYRSFRCDIDGEERSFFKMREERWRPCEPNNTIELFGEYLEKNEKLVRQVIGKVHPRNVGGSFDASSVEQMLDELADVEHGKKMGRFFAGAPEECDLCRCSLGEEKYMVDGRVRETGAWGCMCADCFGFLGEGLGWGVGQLYLRQGAKWLQVAGFEEGSREIE